MGKASRRRKLHRDYRKFGLKREEKEKQGISSLEISIRDTGLRYRSYQEGEDEYKAEATGIYAEMKERGMTLDEFKETFSEELGVIKVEQIEIYWESLDIKIAGYKGLGLIIKHKLEENSEIFPFPNAEDSSAKIPSEVFDYLSPLLSFYDCFR